MLPIELYQLIVNYLTGLDAFNFSSSCKMLYNVRPQGDKHEWFDMFTLKKDRRTLYQLALHGHMYAFKNVKKYPKCFVNACKGGHLELVKMLDPGRNNVRSQGMEKAHKYGRKDVVKYLLSIGVKYYISPMSVACKNGDIDYVRKHLPDVLHKEHTPLFCIVCMHGHKDLINLFIERGYIAIRYGMNAACAKNRMDIAEFLLTKGGEWERGLDGLCKHRHNNLIMSILEEHPEYKKHALECAAYHGNLDVLKSIVDKYGLGGDVLHKAISGDQIDVIKYLHSIGVKAKQSYIDYARRLDYDDIVRELTVRKLAYV